MIETPVGRALRDAQFAVWLNDHVTTSGDSMSLEVTRDQPAFGIESSYDQTRAVVNVGDHDSAVALLIDGKWKPEYTAEREATELREWAKARRSEADRLDTLAERLENLPA